MGRKFSESHLSRQVRNSNWPHEQACQRCQKYACQSDAQRGKPAIRNDQHGILPFYWRCACHRRTENNIIGQRFVGISRAPLGALRNPVSAMIHRHCTLRVTSRQTTASSTLHVSITVQRIATLGPYGPYSGYQGMTVALENGSQLTWMYADEGLFNWQYFIS